MVVLTIGSGRAGQSIGYAGQLEHALTRLDRRACRARIYPAKIATMSQEWARSVAAMEKRPIESTRVANGEHEVELIALLQLVRAYPGIDAAAASNRLFVTERGCTRLFRELVSRRRVRREGRGAGSRFFETRP
jgi:hypothetical protein